jgi:hypothetical protein
MVTLNAFDEIRPPEHTRRLGLGVGLPVVVVCLLVEIVGVAEPDEVVRVEVEVVAEAVTRFPVATGIVGCCPSEEGEALPGPAVHAAGIADCGRALVAQTVTAPLTSRMATIPATRATPVFMVRRGRTGSPEGGSAGAGGLYGSGSADRGSSGGANSGRPPCWPH